MVIFASERELVDVLDRADAMIRACAEGSLDFGEFHQQLSDLQGYYALDGHESDTEESVILERHRARIAWIERILEEVRDVCADEDATKPAYIEAGRFGSDEALRRLQRFVGSGRAQNA